MCCSEGVSGVESIVCLHICLIRVPPHKLAGQLLMILRPAADNIHADDPSSDHSETSAAGVVESPATCGGETLLLVAVDVRVGFPSSPVEVVTFWIPKNTGDIVTRYRTTDGVVLAAAA